MKLKTFIGNYDGRRQGLITVKTKKVACEIIRCSLKQFNEFWNQIDLDCEKKSIRSILDYILYRIRKMKDGLKVFVI